MDKSLDAVMYPHAVLIFIIGVTCLGIVVGSLTQEVSREVSAPTAPKSIDIGVYRPDIDGLRAVAVIAVIVYHLQHSWIPGGFLGVDIFFVISGYVVTGTILRHPSSSFCDCMASFYVRRIKRIAPNLLFVTIVTGTLVAILIWPIAGYVSTLQTGASAIFGYSNIFLAIQSESYFDDPAKDQQNQFLHTWSLGVEEQFYMIYPIVLLIAYGLYQHTKESKACLGGRRSVATWSICIIASFVAQRNSSDPNAAFYLLPFRFWQLATGAFLLDTQAIWSAWVQHWQVAMTLQLMAAVLIILCFGGLATTDPWSADMPGLWMSVLGAVCYIMAGAAAHSSLNGWLSKALPVYIGKVSYSFYLWHWPVITLSPWALPMSYKHPFACLTLSVLIFVVAGIASFSTVEHACRKFQNPRPQLAFGVFFLAACVSLSWTLALSGPLYGKLFTPIVVAGRSSIPKRMLNRSHGPPQCWCAGVRTENEEDNDGEEEAGLRACMLTPQGENIMSQQAPHRSSIESGRCDLHTRGVFNKADAAGTDLSRNESLLPLVVEECLVRGTGTQPRQLFFFGDSHAHAISPGFSIAAAANKFAFRPLTASSHMLSRYLDAVLPVLEKQLHAGDAVVIAHAAYNAASQLEAVMAVHNVTSAKQASMAVVGDLVCDLGNNKFHKGPLCIVDPDSCTVSRQSMYGPSMKKEEAAVFKHMKQVFSDIHVIELGDTFCTSTTCSPFIPSTNVLGIGSTCHFSPAGSSYVWPQLCNSLSSLN